MSDHLEPAQSDLKAKILSDARYARTLNAPDRRAVVMRLFDMCVNAHLEATEEIFELAYGDREGRLYWAGWLTDDFSNLYRFVRLLEVHSGKPQDILYISRSPVLEALSIAVRANPTWLRHNEGKTEIPRQSNHPTLLKGWEICRGPAVDWLFRHPEFREVLPQRLLQFLGEGHDDEVASTSERETSQKAMCREAFAALYPGGIPGAERKPNSVLVRDVERHIRQNGQAPPHETTILRAAGRKPTKNRTKPS